MLLIRKISSCGGNGSIILDNETTVDKGLELLYFLTILDTDNIYECYDFLYQLKIKKDKIHMQEYLNSIGKNSH